MQHILQTKAKYSFMYKEIVNIKEQRAKIQQKSGKRTVSDNSDKHVKWLLDIWKLPCVIKEMQINKTSDMPFFTLKMVKKSIDSVLCWQGCEGTVTLNTYHLKCKVYNSF